MTITVPLPSLESAASLASAASVTTPASASAIEVASFALPPSPLSPPPLDASGGALVSLPASFPPLVLSGASEETRVRAGRWSEFVQRLARVSNIAFAATAPQGAVQLYSGDHNRVAISLSYAITKALK